MKKILSILAVGLVLLCVFAFWGDAKLEGYTVFTGTSMPTNSAAVVELGQTFMAGKPVRLVVDMGQTATSTVASVTVATRAGFGSSLAAAQTIYSNAAVTNDTTTNFAATTYLWHDLSSVTVSNAWTNTIDIKVLLIVDDEP